MSAIRPILAQQIAACEAAAPPNCKACGKRTTTVLQTPMSYLHEIEHPYIVVLVTEVCNKQECELKSRKMIQKVQVMIQNERMTPGGHSMESRELMPCRICHKVQPTTRCAGCDVVAYCGKECQECQEYDWNNHKEFCQANGEKKD